MKITGITVYQADLPLREGTYKWAGEKSLSVFDTTIVQLDTDEGITGWGETCPLGPAYLPSYAEGVRTGIRELAPRLVGQNPLELEKLNRWMDLQMKGHPYVKSGIDMACWDILGKKTGLPVCVLMGGRYGDSFPLYRAISQAPPQVMADSVLQYRRDGYHKFQLKVGGRPDEDIERIRKVRQALDKEERLVADANTGWTQHEAMRVIKAVHDLDVYVEQPCATYEECLAVRKHCHLPFVLDETIDSLSMLARGMAEGAMDLVNIKISKFGGLTRARQARDWCASMGLAMTIEDTWGGDIVTAAIAHLAHSTPTRLLFSSTDFNSYVTVPLAQGAPTRQQGAMAAPTAPGLGITPLPQLLEHSVWQC